MAKLTASQAACEHTDVVPWDCFCTYGPPSCNGCVFKWTCQSCDRMFKTKPLARPVGQVQKPKRGPRR